MPAHNSENNNFNESAVTLQPFVVLFVGVVASLLIVIPLLPVGIPNLTFSFTSINGHAPKIYWYLSRSSGFIGLSFLWLSMALGLSITNKLARLWPGAPTAFAIHEYASLLGLIFVAYHGLVLMGDHYTDFSLPKLLTPFSITYRTTWIGLGQLCFYIWLLTVASFYVRPWIGQTTWRLIHYVNFATYTLGLLHGLNTGTDSVTAWSQWYYWISGVSLVALLAYRIYDAILKKVSIREIIYQRVQDLLRIQITVTYNPLIPKVKSLPPALLREQARKPVAATEAPSVPLVAATAPVIAQPVNTTPVQTIKEDPKETIVAKKIELRALEKREPALSTPALVAPPVMAAAAATTESKSSASKWIEKYESNSGSTKINVRIFKEPTTRPIEELQKYIEAKKSEANTLVLRLTKDFFAIPVQPSTPKQKKGQMIVWEE